MSGRCRLVLLIVAFVAGISSGLSPKTDVEIGIKFDPCIRQVCPAGEVCKAVVSPRLLQLPVARCVKNASKSDNDGCSELTVGSNLFNCKTEQKWTDIARIQCMLRGGVKSLELASVQVQYACYSRTSGRAKFLQADFICCLPAETSPSVKSESSSPRTSTPARDTSKPLQTTDGGTTQVTPSDEKEEGGTSSNSWASPEVTQDEVTVGFYIFLAVFFTLLFLMTVGAVVAYARRRSNARKSSSKAPPTVYINPNCDDHSHLKHSYSNTTLLSTSDLPLVEYQY